jgi:hypothetical protein
MSRVPEIKALTRAVTLAALSWRHSIPSISALSVTHVLTRMDPGACKAPTHHYKPRRVPHHAHQLSVYLSAAQVSRNDRANTDKLLIALYLQLSYAMSTSLDFANIQGDIL